MGGVIRTVTGVVEDVVGGKPKAAVTAPAREIARSTEEQRRMASALRARRIGSRALLGSTLGPDQEQRTTLGVG